MQFLPFQEGLFITAAEPAYRELVGAQVTEFGGKPVGQALAQIGEGVPRDNEGGWTLLQSAYRLRSTGLLQASGLIPDGRNVSLKARDAAGRERMVTVAANMANPDIWNLLPSPAGWVDLADGLSAPPPYLRNRDKPYWFEDLPDRRTLYVGFNQVRDGKDESLAAFSRRLAQHLAEQGEERLIIDLRWNNGGNATLLTPMLAALLQSQKVNQKGRLFVIIGPRTFSAAQTFATEVDRFTNATFVGEPTGSSPNSNFVGEETPFTLPYSKLRVNVSALYWQNASAQRRPNLDRAGALRSAASFRRPSEAGHDPAMEAILALPIPPDPTSSARPPACRPRAGVWPGPPRSRPWRRGRRG